MGSNTPCHYCMQLPVASSRKGRASDCPLCKSPILEDGAGNSFRLPGIVSPGRKRLVLGAVIGLLVCGAAAVWAFHRDTPPASRAPAVARTSLPAQVQPKMETTSPADVDRTSAVRYSECPVATQPHTNPVVPPPPDPPVFRPTAQVKDALRAPLSVAKDAYDVEPLRAIWTQSQVNAATLHEQLLKAPEVTLVEKQARSSKLRDLAAKARELAQAVKNSSLTVQPDGFIHWVKDSHTELAGMPFILGDACQLPNRQAESLGRYSALIRRYLQQSTRGKEPSAAAFWEQGEALQDPQGLPALLQILGPTDSRFQEGLVQHLAAMKDVSATQALVKAALFDLKLEVRAAALVALRERNPAHYRSQLLNAFNYPWAPVAQHAAQAVVFLKRTECVPDLIGLMDAPDPSAPFESKQGKQKLVREMVRVNHHRNCMLCHAPVVAAERRTLAVQVPSLDAPLPSSFSFAYYGSGDLAIRADITYLRQDFSTMQRVKHSGMWPEMQRFDFLVRVRPATAYEVKRWAADEKMGLLSEQRRAVHWALHRLTGKTAEPNAAAWRRAAYRIP
jgi:hypothetical protein